MDNYSHYHQYSSDVRHRTQAVYQHGESLQDNGQEGRRQRDGRSASPVRGVGSRHGGSYGIGGGGGGGGYAEGEYNNGNEGLGQATSWHRQGRGEQQHLEPTTGSTSSFDFPTNHDRMNTDTGFPAQGKGQEQSDSSLADYEYAQSTSAQDYKDMGYSRLQHHHDPLHSTQSYSSSSAARQPQQQQSGSALNTSIVPPDSIPLASRKPTNDIMSKSKPKPKAKAKPKSKAMPNDPLPASTSASLNGDPQHPSTIDQNLLDPELLNLQVQTQTQDPRQDRSASEVTEGVSWRRAKIANVCNTCRERKIG